MITQRAYATNAYQTEFKATVIGSTTVGDHHGVILDRTFFYPTGGGQPHDRGTLEHIPVIDVIEQNESVIHILEGKFETDKVRGMIDWKRRFDHMQQHTGQHVLSQAFIRILGAETIGFHLGEEASTIDLNVSELDWEKIHQVEKEANRVVFGNLQVRGHQATMKTLSKFPLRKPPAVEGSIRIIEVDNYDWSACCGTHVNATGEIGLIKIVRHERYKKGFRVTFLCGYRALFSMQQKTEILEAATRRLTLSETELTMGIDRLLNQQKQFKKTKKQLLTHEAAQWFSRARKIGEMFFIDHIFTNRDAKSVQMLCRLITENPKTVCLFGLSAQRESIILGQSADGLLDLKALTPMVSGLLDGKGGGNPRQIQVSGTKASLLAPAMKKLAERIKSELRANL